MANNIELAKAFVPILDEIYTSASLTSKLDGSSELIKQGANANELIIPKLSMQGLGEYNRNDGYVKGNVTMTNETTKCNFDRGRTFSVDSMDNIETAKTLFGKLAGEFIRTKVVPELDAFRFASYCASEGISKIETGETLTDGSAVVTALRKATNKMDEDEVPVEERYLFITPTLHGMIQDMDTNKSKEILSRFTSVTLVPQTRFYTGILQKDGKTADEENGGFSKATNAKNINFMIIQKSAVIQFEKHIVPKIIFAQDNQTADADTFSYRNVSIADVYENKAVGVYLHHAQV